MKKNVYFFAVLMAFFTVMQSVAQGIEITTGAQVLVTGNATVSIANGNFINNGTYTKGTETITLSGTTAREISGSTNTSVHNLSITNTGGITTKMGQLTANAVSIAEGSKFTIDTVKSVIVTTAVTNSAGTSGLLIKSSSDRANGSLIFHNAYESPVQATIEMYSKAAKATNYKWQYFGVPVRSVVANPTFAGSYLRRYYETALKSESNQWITLNNSSVLESFKAYEITQLNARTLSIAGELENRDTTIQLTYTAEGNYPGQNLIGNPYASAIDITQLTFGAATEATVYLYNTGSYAEWDASSGYGENPGQYVSIPKNIASQPAGLPREIPSMQAFLVKKLQQDADSSAQFTLQISYDSIATKNTTMQRIGAAPTVVEEYPFTSVEVGGSRYYDRMWLFEVPGCSPAFDNGWDGYKIGGPTTVPQIYAAEDSGSFQVNSSDELDGTLLGFRPGEDAEYSMTFTHHKPVSDDSERIYLTDTETNQTVEITESGSIYRFSSTPFGAATSRFLLSTVQVADRKPKPVKDDLQIFMHKRKLFVDNKTKQMAELTIFTVSGKPVFRTSVKSMGRSQIKTNLKPGLYIVEAVTTSNLKANARIVID